jgi:hypothetical protein
MGGIVNVGIVNVGIVNVASETLFFVVFIQLITYMIDCEFLSVSKAIT